MGGRCTKKKEVGGERLYGRSGWLPQRLMGECWCHLVKQSCCEGRLMSHTQAEGLESSDLDSNTIFSLSEWFFSFLMVAQRLPQGAM